MARKPAAFLMGFRVWTGPRPLPGLLGSARLFATDGGTPRVVKTGESFYEPTGAVHTTSASALPDRPVKLLAIIVAQRGSPTTIAKP